MPSIPQATTASDPQWYKDAVIYQTHVKAFFDANNDGVGDLEGLIAKLDYIQELGVSAIWLLPFYPSPLRDDGYDIADYREVNPSYGTMRDVRRLIHEAHRRGLRVITELVINHTSDQHAWFQRARRSRPGSTKRNYYVWSDTDQKYRDTRIIFLDTEKSNWTWDPEAKAYFWHRFYSHQPDLNFDNPAVMQQILSLLHYWLEMGIDGLRLDAIPYLVEREGTSCENLPETHAVLKRIRAEIDLHFADRMLLAEANQWPEDTRPYFGDGDECHMAFHFPLMPRMYLAIAQEDRNPITDIMRQTPDIPEGCQWAIFLRNHDELTLEMVTQNEREYLWNTYAADRRMRINLGIRRRLAPLLDNDRRKIELMNALLLSMPGTPVIYYGDEIGMGDNVYLGDRDGVRTPMQWSPDRNGGFSRANPQQLYAPPIQDPIYGYQAVNVEAQQQSPGSLLSWMKRLIGVRRGRRTFGRGTLTFLYPRNRKVLAYLREHEDETILCIYNLSRNAQACDLELTSFRDRVPIELLGRTTFPPITEATYRLTLPGYGFFWLALAAAGELTSWHQPVPEPLPELITIVVHESWRAISESQGGRDLARYVLPEYLPKQPWFDGRSVETVRMARAGAVHGPERTYLLAELSVERAESAPCCLLPFAASWGEEHLAPGAPLLPYTLARVRRGPHLGALHDATYADDFARTLLGLMARGEELVTGDLDLLCRPGVSAEALAVAADAPVRRIGRETANSLLIVDDRVLLKIYRRLEPGPHPELEMSRYLGEVAHFEHVPRLLGSIENRRPDGQATAYVGAFPFVSSHGNGWEYALDHLDRVLEESLHAAEGHRPSDAELHEPYRAAAMLVGRRTADLHRALAADTDDPAFAPERFTADDLIALRDRCRADLADGLDALSRTGAVDGDADAVLAARSELLRIFEELPDLPPELCRTRVHGDYRLAQVLVAQGDVMIIDLEGETDRPLSARRAKALPVTDLACMIRSFDLAAWTSLSRFAETHTPAQDRLAGAAAIWRELVVDAFMAEYRAVIAGCPSWPGDAAADTLLQWELAARLGRELGRDAATRPAAALAGLARLAGTSPGPGNTIT
ncbi:MAG: maltose alpha-D-glucosyltransferase [Geminicoccaceae bacterium]